MDREQYKKARKLSYLLEGASSEVLKLQGLASELGKDELSKLLWDAHRKLENAYIDDLRDVHKVEDTFSHDVVCGVFDELLDEKYK